MENMRKYSTPRRHSNDGNAHHQYQYQYQPQQQHQHPRSAGKYYVSNGYNQYSESEQRQYAPQSATAFNRNLHSQAQPFVPQGASSFNANTNRANFPSNASVFTPKTSQSLNNTPVNAENSSSPIKLNEDPEFLPPVVNLNNSN